MTKRFSWVFLLLSGLFFFFMVGLTGYRIEDARQKNAEEARQHFTELAAKVQSLKDSTGGFDAPQFRTDTRVIFNADPRLLLLSVHSSDQGILYLVTRNKSFLKEPAEVTADWRGTPVYQVSKGYELLLSKRLDDAEPTVDAVFVTMGREDLYPVVRDDLYLFLAFLLVCAVIILIATGIQEEPARPMAYAAPPAETPRTVEMRPPVCEPPRAPPLGPQPMVTVVVEPARPAAPAAEVARPAAPAAEVARPAAPVAAEVARPATPGVAAEAARPAAPIAEPARPAPVVAAEPGPAPAASATPAPEAEPVQPRAAAAAPARPAAEVARPSSGPGTDPAWLEYLEPRLEAELSRAESSDLDLSLARLRLDHPNVDARLSLVIAEVTRIIRESFPLHDMIFESGDDSCTILIPDVEIDAAVHSLDDLRGRISSTPLEGRRRTISVGVSSRAGRLIDARTLLEEADVSLAKATREGGDQVIGFRADAARFRESLTGSRT